MFRIVFLYRCWMAGKIYPYYSLNPVSSLLLWQHDSMPSHWHVLTWNVSMHKHTPINLLFSKNNFRKAYESYSKSPPSLSHGQSHAMGGSSEPSGWVILLPAPEGHIRVLIFLEISGSYELVEHSLLKTCFCVLFVIALLVFLPLCLFLPIINTLWLMILYLFLKCWCISCLWL